ncbi:NAD(P)/FAD-dependent oxidoreductase [Cochlodiniinecator piscidefendens]|uniref:NAD(P)/FAD-dependent oxidoreductase n=1 Tax=Cochlodiniinecator piscidefendens TaxID=2715756 RepID=UPI00140B4210|nr:FAD-dependent oxidoreductase [Cochlodiniinecator piscidefendens]
MLDQSTGSRKKIAIVGGGVSGLSAAYYLSAHHDITLFEAGTRLGGHARTVLAGRNGDQPVDTGFIVFNYATYPHLTRLFQDLDVPVQKSDMSFCASIDDGSFEYGLNSLHSLLAQKSNLFHPQFYRMIRDTLYFGKHAKQAADSDDITIGELVQKLGLSTAFRDLYLLPMCGAIWSTPIADIDSFPAKSLVRFFQNHALLAGSEKRQWWTVKGGSIEYVKRLETALRARGCNIQLGAPVDHAQRSDLGVTVTSKGTQHTFDEIILACHSDQALAILGDGASPDEKQALSTVRYQTNTAVLHADPAQMPKRRACWSSWAYQSQTGNIGVTYWMNKLQNIDEADPLFLTLNPARPIKDELIYDTVEYAHPVFDRKALIAQEIIRELQGNNRTWFAGAWNRHGFHEDGIASAMRIVRAMNTATYTEGKQHATSKQSFEKSVSFNLRASA